MRMMLALGILAFAMMGAAGPPICASGCAARAEEPRPVLKKSDFLRIQTPAETVPDQHERLMRELRHLTVESHRRYALEEFKPQPVYERPQAPEEVNPQVERERRRKFRRGDFWPRKDFDRAFQDFDRFQGFEQVVPPGR